MGWSVETLFGLEGEAFEAERRRLISAEIMKAAPERREALLLMQAGLDEVRDQVSSADFLQICFERIRENLENVLDQYVAIGHLSGKKPSTPPNHQDLT
jgi:hypothetical protein